MATHNLPKIGNDNLVPPNENDGPTVGNPTIPALARGVVTDTFISKSNDLVVEVTNPSFTEPKSAANADNQPIYPYNNIQQTESGHTFELDDTPARERIRLQHRVGTFIEMHPNGDEVHKVYGDGYEITIKNKNVLIKGTCNITIEGDSNLHVLGDVMEKVDGSYTLDVTGPVVINGVTVNINHGTNGAARIGDTADTGDDGTGSHFDVNSPGTNIIETGSGTVFIGD